ncbi:MAG: DNA internalization-related competence protein ComEC/Rec2 [Nitrospirae bacterium]|nr:DNA internalization-related competence protein ComEC/Rec2 [Nitrospirota bacterium]
MRFLLAFIGGVTAFYAFQYFPYLTVILLLLSLALILRSMERKSFFLLGLIVFGILYVLVRQPHSPYLSRIEAEINGVFSSAGLRTEDGFAQEFKVSSIRDIENFQKRQSMDLNLHKLDIFSDRQFEHGRRCRLKVTIYMPGEKLNPGDFERPYAVLQSVIEEKDLSLLETTRAKINESIKKNFLQDSASLIMAVTTGQREEMSAELKEAFNLTGLAHLLSISGTHFGLFSMLIFAIFRLLIGLLPYSSLERLTVYVSPSQASSILAIPFMLFYLGISGASIPSIRSFVMISLFLFGILISKKGYWLNFLLFAGVILILWEPEVVLDLSFLMSFSAVFFIGLFLRDRIPRAKLKSYPLNSLLITLTATLGVAPFVLYYFHRFSLISPITNLIVTPIVGFILVPVSLLDSLLYLMTGSSFTAPLIGNVSNLSIFLVRSFAGIPFSSVGVPAFPIYIIIFYYACFLMYAVFKKRYILFLPLILVVVYSVYAGTSERHLTVTFLAPSQGDASVIELVDGRTIAVDTGKSGHETVGYLRYHAISELSALVLSHGHEDHIGGIGYLLKRFWVREIWDNGDIFYPGKLPSHIKHRTLKRGDYIKKDGYSIYVFHPYKEFYTSHNNTAVEENNDSLVIRVEGKIGFLFTGDIEEETEEDISHLGKWLKSKVLKVPHHGSVKSIHKGFFDAVSPEIAVITSKRLNQKMQLALSPARLYLTGRDGAIKIEDKPEGLLIKTYTDFNLKKTKGLNEEIKNIKRLFVVW